MKTAALSKRFPAATVALVAVIAVGLFAWLHHGPRYRGKPASDWVEELLRDNVNARQALRSIGPAAVPALTDALERRRGRFWSWLEAWRPMLPRFIARKIPSRALDQLLQERAIEVLYEFGPASAPAVPALLKVDASLNDSFGFGPAGLAHATLVQIGPAGLPYLIRMLRSNDSKIRAKAATHIGHLGSQAGAAAPALARALKDSMRSVRSSAVIALDQIGPPARKAIPELKAALRQEDDYFRLEVIHALWTVGRESETTVPILIRILDDRNNPNRAGAAMALAEMGPAAKAAAPALTGVTREEFSYTRVKAEEALRQIKVEPSARGNEGNPNDQ